MKIGCCLPSKALMPQGEINVPIDAHKMIMNSSKIAVGIGFNFTEVGAGFLHNLTEKGMEKLTLLADSNQLHVEVVNHFIPNDLIILDKMKKQRVQDYVGEIFDRASKLKIDTIVFGSARARCIPYTMSRQEGEKGIFEFLKMCNTLCEKYNITLAVEPINHNETNIFNTLDETAKVVRSLESPHIKLMADSYHMWCEKENLTDLEKYKDILTHIHVSEPPNRNYPGSSGGEYLKELSKELKNIGYDKRISAECMYLDFMQEMRLIHSFLNENF